MGSWRAVALFAAGVSFGLLGAKLGPIVRSNPQAALLDSTASRQPKKDEGAARDLAADCEDLHRELQALDLENKELNGLLSAADKRLADEILGVPAAWTDSVPLVLSPDGFPDHIERVVAECQFESDLIEVDCSEPPCMAVFRGREDDFSKKLQFECKTWIKSFGMSLVEARSAIACENGEAEDVLIVGAPSVWDHVEDPRPDDPKNMGKRLKVRMDSAKADWKCLSD